jgi:hypothetical protein
MLFAVKELQFSGGCPLSIFAINEKHNLGVLKQEFLPLMKWKN